MMNAAPPLFPASTGKRQMLPNPTAEPAVASTMPSLLAKSERSFLISFLFGLGNIRQKYAFFSGLPRLFRSFQRWKRDGGVSVCLLYRFYAGGQAVVMWQPPPTGYVRHGSIGRRSAREGCPRFFMPAVMLGEINPRVTTN